MKIVNLQNIILIQGNNKWCLFGTFYFISSFKLHLIVFSQILFSHKKEWSFVVCRWTDGIGKHHPKWSQSDSEDQRLHVLSHTWHVVPIQIQQNYEKQVTLRGGHLRDREGKRRKLRRWVWLMYLLYKNEDRIFKPVEITIRRGLSRRKIEGMNQSGL
jgi:hypothetical protein